MKAAAWILAQELPAEVVVIYSPKNVPWSSGRARGEGRLFTQHGEGDRMTLPPPVPFVREGAAAQPVRSCQRGGGGSGSCVLSGMLGSGVLTLSVLELSECRSVQVAVVEI